MKPLLETKKENYVEINILGLQHKTRILVSNTTNVKVNLIKMNSLISYNNLRKK